MEQEEIPQVQPLVKYQYRLCIKTLGRTETILLKFMNNKLERIEPFDKERSLSKAHGEDYYLLSQVQEADFIVQIEVSNSGRHYCKLKKFRNDPEAIKLLIQWLKQNEHICYSLYSQLGEISQKVKNHE